MKNKLGELTILAHLSMGLPTTLNIGENAVAVDIFYSDSIFLPAMLIITNTLHYRATDTQLMEIEGRIIRSSDSPMGIKLNGDICVNKLQYPLGYIELCIKKTIRLTMDLLNKDKIEDLSKYWAFELFADIEEGDAVSYKQYCTQDILKGVL